MRHEARQEILKINKVFTSHLLAVQNAKHAPKSEYSEGDKLFLDDSEETLTLSKSMADDLNTKNKEDFELESDTNPFGSIQEYKFAGRLTLISDKKDTDSYLQDIASSLEILRQKTNNDNLIVIGDWTKPWLYQKNDYKPVKESLEWLGERIDYDFNGGFLLKEKDIIQFIPRLFWMIRCNMELPEIMMTYENFNSVISICQYVYYILNRTTRMNLMKL